MRKEYDFSKAKRGPLPNLPPLEELDRHIKVRITMFVDNDVLKFFKARAAKRGAVPYQTQINQALREHMTGTNPAVTEALRRVTERAARYSVAPADPTKRRNKRRGAEKGSKSLQRTIKAAIRAGEESGYVAECLEIPVISQGATLDEVAANLKEAVALHLADEDLARLGLTADPTLLVTLELSAAHG